MGPLELDICEHAGQEYPEASQLYCHETCMVCENRQWVELSKWPQEEKESE
jgi:hypothetical protein